MTHVFQEKNNMFHTLLIIKMFMIILII